MTSIRACPVDPRSPQPAGNTWKLESCFSVDGETIHRWVNGTVVACASRHAALESKRTKLIVPCFHVSISDNGQRPSDDVIRGVLAEFNMEGADEDNHSPGRARHFWLDEGRVVQPECDCKSTEETIVEPDGYRWQRERAVP